MSAARRRASAAATGSGVAGSPRGGVGFFGDAAFFAARLAAFFFAIGAALY